MALKDFEGEKPTWKDTSRCVKQVEEGNPTSILPKAKAAWGAAVPERGGTPESCCWHRCPQDGTRGPSGSRCISKTACPASEFWCMVFWAEPTAITQRFHVMFWAPGTLLQDASCQAEDTGVPLVLHVD